MRMGVPALFQLFVVICTFISISQGLVCRSCQGDPQFCARSKRTQTCQSFPGDPNSTEICASYYTWDNGKPTVQKMCKARNSCLRDAAQQDNVCGTHDGKDKPCRCCCEKNNCNRLPKGCIVDSVCPKAKNLPNGYVECGRSNKRGGRCNFICNPGFELLGPKISRCVLDQNTGKLKWNTRGQNCVPIVRCSPMLQAPGNGTMECTNSPRHRDKSDYNHLWSKCTFECNAGFKRQGTVASQCRETRKWSVNAPECIPRQCASFPSENNREHFCTNGELVGSICAFKCDKGFKLIGSTSIACKGDAKDRNSQDWTADPPKCMRIKCEPIQQSPVNGKIKCTNKNFENSVCIYSCDVGYDVDGTPDDVIKTRCEDDGGDDNLGQWSHAPATCTRITCKPELKKPLNGKLLCSDKNNLNSQCDIYCNAGYDLEDTELRKVSSTCEADVDGDEFGIWSLTPPPDCSPIVREPRLADPLNGKVVCTQDNRFGSRCTFRCDEFYDMNGTNNITVSSTCVEGGNGEPIGKWTLPTPTCSLITCPALHDVVHGQYACTADNVKGSVCVFKCNAGYEISGSGVLSCEDKLANGNDMAEWTSPQPVCVTSYCDAQTYDKTKLNRQCSTNGVNRFEVGTVCTYTCADDGNYLVDSTTMNGAAVSGSIEDKCLENKEWSLPPPRCLPITCRSLDTPTNGYPPECSNGQFYLSKCEFQCHAKYAPSHRESLTCIKDDKTNDKFGAWSQKAPVCVKNECEEFPSVRYGSIAYTNHYKIGSVAQLKCNDGYTEKFNTTVCRAPKTGRKDPFWSRTRNVCCVRCVINKKLKLVMAIDKTVYNSDDAWEDIMTWYTHVVEFLFTRGFEINFGLILYDLEVDMDNSQRLRLIQNLDDIYEIRDGFYDAPRGAAESDTGLAVEYAWSTMFKNRKKEEPFLILIKNTQSTTFFREQGQRLRREGLNILALDFLIGNIEAKREHLTSVTGDMKNVFLINGIPDLDKVGERISDISKEKGCTVASRNRRCMG